LSFYTCVNRYGNKILYRGYDDNGERFQTKIPFKPTMYLQSNKPATSGWKAFDGTNVEPIEIDSMSEATEFVKKYEGIDNFKIHGNNNFVAQFIAEKFPGIVPYSLKKIEVGNIDIEVMSDEGFPEPDVANYPIISIAYKSSLHNVFHVWGLGEYDASKSELELDGAMIQYRHCTSEDDLMLKFLTFWSHNCPDIITGWNLRFFDIPYMINRTTKILGNDVVKKFSPFGVVKHRQINVKGKNLDAYEMYGVQQMDYYDLFTKFGYSYGSQASYTLDHIASVVLGKKKLSYAEYGSLHTLYKHNHQKFIDYNIRDVQVVDQIDKQTGLMDLALIVAYKGGVNYMETFGTTSIWDSIIYRYLNERKIAVPPSARKHKESYPGGYVKDPHVGMSKWVTSFDLNSLYPNLIVQYNMSPETLLNDPSDFTASGVEYYMKNGIDDELRERNVSVAVNGSMYRNDKRGVLPEIIIGLYNERKEVKRGMLVLMQDYEKNKTPELSREINRLENTQMAIKILLNSLYGALGNQYFRYFDMRIAEGITLSGQLAIKWAEQAMNDAMNGILKSDDKDYVIAMDTDSLYVNMEPLVNAVNPKDPVKFIDQACEQKIVPILAKAYDRMFTQMNAFENRMVMAREAIADKGIWMAKKRYILNVHNNEGVQYAEPKLKVMGIEAVKSSTPQVVRDKFVKAYKLMLNSTEAELQKFVAEFFEEFKTLPPEDVSFPRGVSDIAKWKDKHITYKSGTPIHVRGALLYNEQLKKAKLNTEEIKNGTKVKFCYMKMPNPIMENVISFAQFLPEEFGLHQYVDYETQFNKTFKEPLKLVSDAINWELEYINSLEGFFS
jgi:DNA polymerase elongation subunit (family B)